MSRAPSDAEYVAVIGLARSGRAAAALLARQGRRVYVSDSGSSDELRSTAARLEQLGMEVQLGGHDPERIARASLVVVSPGIPPDAPALRAAAAAGVPVLSEVAIALRALPESRVVAVTGTNGKSTVTAIVAHLLNATGRPAVAAGNIGRALAELALEENQPEWIALEISSFQLHDTPEFTPLVGVLTNLAPDHLDRYPGVAEYYADKARMFAAAHERSLWVTNGDDPEVQRLSAAVAGERYNFSVRAHADAWYDSRTRMLQLFDAPLCARDELQLFGEHNIANALAAALAVAVASGGRAAPVDRLGRALTTFTGLPHRLERVADAGGVLWVNDSKATNVEAARVGIEAMERPTVLLLGGRHKGQSYSGLADSIQRHVRHIVAYGEAGSIIERELSPLVHVDLLGSDFGTVVERARAVAQPGDVVLLAPACSSFDMFRDYEERGLSFARLARQQ